MSRTLLDFVSAVRRSGLVAPEALDQIVTTSEKPDAEPKSVAKWIVRNGWLSSFQVKMFWNGRGDDLILGQYELVEKLGEGGMGEVFRARHRWMGRDVALKVIRRERVAYPEAVLRFQREIRAVAQLAHENVVMAYDADQQGDIHFFAMELVEGINLSQKVRESGPLPVQEACNYVHQAACGLQHAHERGLVHRDIKPSNLLLSKTGVIKLLDLGLARLYDREGGTETRITQEGLVIGTPDFIAPEQARDSRQADIRSDIYALGCTLYFLLTVESPYCGVTPTEKMLKHSTEPIPDITLKRGDIPLPLRRVLETMMAKSPADRFQTPAEVGRALHPFLIAAPAGIAPPTPHFPTVVPLAEPVTDSLFRIKETDGKVELNSIYRPREGKGVFFLVLLGFGMLILAGMVFWILSQE
jgi:eukaryotic-like serine/threonine-protein kinase